MEGVRLCYVAESTEKFSVPKDTSFTATVIGRTQETLNNDTVKNSSNKFFLKRKLYMHTLQD